MKALPAWFTLRLIVDPRGCWVFDGARNANGYGVINYQGKARLAHRVAFHLATGFDLDSSLGVLHECDNPACCRPSQLFAGTQQDNTRDMYRKGRGMRKECKARGERQHSARYTEDQVRAMRSSGLDATTLARMYGGTRQAVGAILMNRTWTHVAPEAKKVLRRTRKVEP